MRRGVVQTKDQYELDASKLVWEHSNGESSRILNFTPSNKEKIASRPDGQLVGNRETATVFNIHPKLLRNWGSQEGELRKSSEGNGSYDAHGVVIL